MYKNLFVKLVVVEVNNKQYYILITEKLYQINENIKPKFVNALIRDFQKKCIKFDVNYQMFDFIRYVDIAIELLKNQAIIDTNVAKDLLANRTYFFKLMSSDVALVHGDVSNANIMMNKNNQMFLLDWEDAFYANKDYDLLYWLTFLSQKNYKYDDIKDYVSLSRDECICILLMIVLLKSYISVKNGKYKKNMVKINDRIESMYYF